jgi:FtsH-binding integral membrane protein
MGNGPWNQQQAQFANEVRKEFHRQVMEYLAIGLVIVAAIACGVAMVLPATTSKTDDGKVTVSGPSESAKSAAQTVLTTIVGAAIGYAFKRSPSSGAAPAGA